MFGTCDLTNHLIIVSVQCLSEYFTADGIKLGDKVSSKKPQVVFLEHYSADLVNLLPSLLQVALPND